MDLFPTLVADATSTGRRERMPTNTLSRRHRVQRWANFIAGFSVEFVEQCLAEVDCELGTVLDPFLGCGTTLVAARNLGFRGVGFEPHPLFHTLSVAKLLTHVPRELESIHNVLACAEARPVDWSPSASAFLAKLFEERDLRRIQTAASALTRLPARQRALGTAVFLRACERSCGSQTDGIYKAPTTRKRSVPFGDALDLTVAEFAEDVASRWYRDHWARRPQPEVHATSSEDMSKLPADSVAACVTSPPYLNNFDFAEMTRMGLYLLGWASSWGDITEKIRSKLITNTTTALVGKREPTYQRSCRDSLPTSILPELESVVSALELERRARAGKKPYDQLVYPYYGQIKAVIAEVFRVLMPGARVHWIVADAALYGVHIRTHEHTAGLFRATGFADVSVECMRRRGHRWVLDKRDGAKGGLGEFLVTARKPAR